MYKVRDVPVGISLFLIFLIGLEIYFLYSFLTQGLFVHYGYTLGDLSSIPYLMVLLFLFTLVAISLVAIVYGFLERRPWARKFTILFLVWATLWLLWGLLVGNNVIEQFILLVIYLILIAYLMSSYVKDHFRKNIYRYGEYTLYEREVELKSGMTLTIYFFSKKKPKSGTPTSMPYGYTVKINKRSNMPYLKKQRSRRPTK